jgi:hypothetical protein
MNRKTLVFRHFAELQTSWKVDIHSALVLRPRCVPKKVGINQKGRNKK